MAPELFRAQSYCTTPALALWPGQGAKGTPERTGVATDDHGWQKHSGTGLINLHLGSAVTAEAVTSSVFVWYLFYYFTNGQQSSGDYEEVLQFGWIVSSSSTVFSVRLYNDSGTQKFRIWNNTADSQVGSDSAAITVGQTMLFNLRADSSGDTLTLFVDGSSVISASQALDDGASAGTFNAGAASTGTSRYWSAACLYASGSDDLNEAHYPEMRLIHPDGEGNYDDYDDGTSSTKGTADWSFWDDLVAKGDPNGDTDLNSGQDASNQIQTSTMTTHAMTNTIQAVTEFIVLRQDQASKTVVHGGIIRVGSTDKVVSFGSEDIGEDYLVREAVFHTPPDGGAWDQANEIDALEAGHRRDAGSEALNIRVTAMAIVVVALGTTNLAPPDPPATPDSGAIPRTSGVSLGSANAMIL